MPEPCMGRGWVPHVDLRAWNNVTGQTIDPRSKRGFWAVLEARIEQQRRTGR